MLLTNIILHTGSLFYFLQNDDKHQKKNKKWNEFRDVKDHPGFLILWFLDCFMVKKKKNPIFPKFYPEIPAQSLIFNGKMCENYIYKSCISQ